MKSRRFISHLCLPNLIWVFQRSRQFRASVLICLQSEKEQSRYDVKPLYHIFSNFSSLHLSDVGLTIAEAMKHIPLKIENPKAP
jgi:hypothetical protein